MFEVSRNPGDLIIKQGQSDEKEKERERERERDSINFRE
jgi:hypothetical protein